MVNIDKEKINENINDAYNNQTEKVKQLLESAKKNLADQKECLYDYTANKEKAKQTKELMDGLITLADQMDEYTSSNALL